MPSGVRVSGATGLGGGTGAYAGMNSRQPDPGHLAQRAGDASDPALAHRLDRPRSASGRPEVRRTSGRPLTPPHHVNIIALKQALGHTSWATQIPSKPQRSARTRAGYETSAWYRRRREESEVS